MTAEEAWNNAYSQLELQFDRASFDTWLRGASFIDVQEDIFVIGVRNNYARDMLQHRLYRNVRRVLSDVCGHPVELRFEVTSPRPKAKKASVEEDAPLLRLLAEQTQDSDEDDAPAALHERVARPAISTLPENELNPRFVFDRFVVNGSNRIAYEAALAIAEYPARAYNPFLIYGGVGLGKTHLLQAIGQVCQAKGLRIIYIPSEVFTNDLVASIRSKTTAMFRDKYRSADVLLVDDIQFIAGKDSTQEEFFHTFNALYTFNKQIILASDRHPSELSTLDDRLRSRFGGGLVSDVGPLEFESRLAILEMWAQERGLMLDRPVMQMVAEHAQNNVRELEGVFNQIVAKAQLGRSSLTLKNAESVLERFERPRQHRRAMTIERIIEATAAHFRLTAADIMGKDRSNRVNQARQIAMFLVRELTDTSLPNIGDAFGGRAHTTVLHGCNKIADEIHIDDSLRYNIDQIRTALGG